jgi:hypothetical protein
MIHNAGVPTYKAACQRGGCGWYFFGADYDEVLTRFLTHLRVEHPDPAPGSIGIMELGCEDAWEDLDALFEEEYRG